MPRPIDPDNTERASLSAPLRSHNDASASTAASDKRQDLVESIQEQEIGRQPSSKDRVDDDISMADLSTVSNLVVECNDTVKQTQQSEVCTPRSDLRSQDAHVAQAVREATTTPNITNSLTLRAPSFSLLSLDETPNHRIIFSPQSARLVVDVDSANLMHTGGISTNNENAAPDAAVDVVVGSHSSTENTIPHATPVCLRHDQKPNNIICAKRKKSFVTFALLIAAATIVACVPVAVTLVVVRQRKNRSSITERLSLHPTTTTTTPSQSPSTIFADKTTSLKPTMKTMTSSPTSPSLVMMTVHISQSPSPTMTSSPSFAPTISLSPLAPIHPSEGIPPAYRSSSPSQV